MTKKEKNEQLNNNIKEILKKLKLSNAWNHSDIIFGLQKALKSNCEFFKQNAIAKTKWINKN